MDPEQPADARARLVDDRADALRYLARTAYPTLYNPEHETLGLPADKHAPPGGLLRPRLGRASRSSSPSVRCRSRASTTPTTTPTSPRTRRPTAGPSSPSSRPAGDEGSTRPAASCWSTSSKPPPSASAPPSCWSTGPPTSSATTSWSHRARGPGRAAHRAVRRPPGHRLRLRWFPPQQAALARVPPRPCAGRRRRGGQHRGLRRHRHRGRRAARQHEPRLVGPGRRGAGGPCPRDHQGRLRALRRQHAHRQPRRPAGGQREDPVQRAGPGPLRLGPRAAGVPEPAAVHGLGRGGGHQPRRHRFRFPVPPPGERYDFVITAPTFEALADELAQRLEKLAPWTGGLPARCVVRRRPRRDRRAVRRHGRRRPSISTSTAARPRSRRPGPEPPGPGAATAALHRFAPEGRTTASSSGPARSTRRAGR